MQIQLCIWDIFYTKYILNMNLFYVLFVSNRCRKYFCYQNVRMLLIFFYSSMRKAKKCFMNKTLYLMDLTLKYTYERQKTSSNKSLNWHYIFEFSLFKTTSNEWSNFLLDCNSHYLHSSNILGEKYNRTIFIRPILCTM